MFVCYRSTLALLLVATLSVIWILMHGLQDGGLGMDGGQKEDKDDRSIVQPFHR